MRSFAASRCLSRFLRKLGGVRLFMDIKSTLPHIVAGLLFDAPALFSRPEGPNEMACAEGEMPSVCKKAMVVKRKVYSHLS
jgi:hypothetical protein